MRFLAALALLALAACVSNVMKPYVGRPIQDAMIDFGAPEQVIAMPDGRKAYQFRYGGGSVVTPGYATTTAATYGNTTTYSTMATPAAVYQSNGCLLTFITGQTAGAGEIIQEYRVPKGLTC
jgi:hypothetical protein